MRRPLLPVFILIFGGFFVFASFATYKGYIRQECVETAIIVSISKVGYRYAWYELDNGETIKRNQARNMYPGKEICIKSRHVNELFD